MVIPSLFFLSNLYDDLINLMFSLIIHATCFSANRGHRQTV